MAGALVVSSSADVSTFATGCSGEDAPLLVDGHWEGGRHVVPNVHFGSTMDTFGAMAVAETVDLSSLSSFCFFLSFSTFLSLLSFTEGSRPPVVLPPVFF